VKIVKAISKASKLLIFDEPAVGLTEREMEYFIELLKNMKNNGITSIYLSHELKEVLNFSDRITVNAFGEKDPVSRNTTPEGRDDPEGRRYNRRVELVFNQVPSGVVIIRYNDIPPDLRLKR
jgi:ABC-type branched-subunit amino acid transport system ATPase component